MLSKKTLTVLAAASLTCLTVANGWAQTAVVVTTTTTTSNVTSNANSGSSLSDDALVSRYTLLTGSKANAQSLVAGLRTGSAVTLVSTTSAPAVTFTPTTQDMGYGNINIALALAKTALAKQGITNPTPAQLAAALNGGSITLANGTVVTMAGVLTQRSAGMGWGNIAKTMNVKLGTVVSASNIDKANQEDKKDAHKNDVLTKADNAKHTNSNNDAGASHGKVSSTSSSNSAGGSSNGGGSKSNAGGGNSGGGNSSGGNSGGGNGGGNSGGGKK